MKIGLSDKVYEAAKLTAIVDTLVEQGIAPSKVLEGLGLQPEDLHASDTRVSVNQLTAAFRNALRLSTDSDLPYRIGTNIHLSAYGMYGYALLCSTDFRHTMEFAQKYHLLAAPLAAIAFAEEKGVAGWTVEPIGEVSADNQLYRFITELQIGIHISLLRDVMGPDFVPQEIWLSYSPASDFGLTENMTGCRVLFDQQVNRLVFDARWLDEKPKLGNRNTYSTVTALCDGMLSDIRTRTGVAGNIRMILLQDISNRPNFEAIAALLHGNSRTLRRQLRIEGTTFREVWDELRKQMAIKYLRETSMTNDDIAFALGFNDASNFRQAFRRWTQKTPNTYRTRIITSRPGGGSEIKKPAK